MLLTLEENEVVDELKAWASCGQLFRYLTT